MLINVDDDKLRKIADTLRTLSSSRIKISHSDLARFIIGETTREIDCSPQNFARVLADLLDRPISEPYVSKTSGRVCCSICRKPLGECGFPEVVRHCRNCGVKVDDRILMAIDAGRELAEELSDERQRAQF